MLDICVMYTPHDHDYVVSVLTHVSERFSDLNFNNDDPSHSDATFIFVRPSMLDQPKSNDLLTTAFTQNPDQLIVTFLLEPASFLDFPFVFDTGATPFGIHTHEENIEAVKLIIQNRLNPTFAIEGEPLPVDLQLIKTEAHNFEHHQRSSRSLFNYATTIVTEKPGTAVYLFKQILSLDETFMNGYLPQLIQRIVNDNALSWHKNMLIPIFKTTLAQRQHWEYAEACLEDMHSLHVSETGLHLYQQDLAKARIGNLKQEAKQAVNRFDWAHLREILIVIEKVDPFNDFADFELKDYIAQVISNEIYQLADNDSLQSAYLLLIDASAFVDDKHAHYKSAKSYLIKRYRNYLEALVHSKQWALVVDSLTTMSAYENDVSIQKVHEKAMNAYTNHVMEIAKQHEADGDWQQAQATLKSLLVLSPENMRIRNAYEHLNIYPEAQAFYQLIKDAHEQADKQTALSLIGLYRSLYPTVGDPDNLLNSLVDGNLRDSITLYRDLATGSGHSGAVYAVDVAPNGRLCASAGADSTIRLWELPELRQVAVLRRLNDKQITYTEFSPNGKLVVSLSQASIVRIWAMPEGSEVFVYNESPLVTAVTFLNDSQHLVIGDISGKIRILDLHQQVITHTWQAHASVIKTIYCSRAGQRMVTGSNDKTVKVWNPLVDNRLRHTFAEYRWMLNTATIAPSGKYLAIADNDYRFEVVEMETYNVRLQGDHKEGTVIKSLAFSNNSKFVASGGGDSEIRIWSVQNGELLKVLDGHKLSVTRIVFTPDDEHILSSSADGTVKLWGL